MTAQVAAFEQPTCERPEAEIYCASGFTALPIVTAGLENIAAKLGLGAGGILPLAALMIWSFSERASDQGHGRAAQMLRHPALQRLREARLTSETRPKRACGRPLKLDAIHDRRKAARLEALQGNSSLASPPASFLPLTRSS